MNLQTKLDEMRKRCEAAIEHVANARSEASAPMTSREYIIDECCHAVHYMDEIHKDLPLLISALQVCLGALEEFRLGHVHAADLPHTRSYGDNYGWCDYCQTKVSWGPGDAEMALAKAKALLVGEEE